MGLSIELSVSNFLKWGTWEIKMLAFTVASTSFVCVIGYTFVSSSLGVYISTSADCGVSTHYLWNIPVCHNSSSTTWSRLYRRTRGWVLRHIDIPSYARHLWSRSDSIHTWEYYWPDSPFYCCRAMHIYEYQSTPIMKYAIGRLPLKYSFFISLHLPVS